MWKAKAITKWNETAEGKQPDAVRFLQAGDSLMDITGETCEVSSPVVVEVWSADGKAIEEVKNDKDYGAVALLAVWEEKDNG